MSAHLNRPDADAFLRALSGLAKVQTLYPAGHTAVARALELAAQVLQRVFRDNAALLVGRSEGYLVVADEAFLDPTPHSQALSDLLAQREVEAVLFQPGADAKELACFCRWLRSTGPEAWSSDNVTVTRLDREGAVWEKGVRAYREALGALEEAYKDSQAGAIPSPTRARDTVSTFLDLVAENPFVVKGLSLLKDYDRYTYHHSVNVCLHSLVLGRHAGLAAHQLMCLGFAGLFHDIGKTRAPPEIVRKPSKLSSSEWLVIWRHPEYGKQILEEMGDVPPVTPQIVYEHHMRFDGGGYPPRPAGYSISRLSPFVAVSDVYDAMTSHRPYSAPRPLPEAVSVMAGLRGTHFSPEVLDCFLAVIGRVPVGSVIRLASGEVAVVSRVGEEGVNQVRPVLGANGQPMPNGIAPREITAAEVVTWVDPLVHGIDPFRVLRGCEFISGPSHTVEMRAQQAGSPPS